jgi:hypothetical protein
MAQALGKSKYGTRNALLKSKWKGLRGYPPPFVSALPLEWGVRYEAMAARCYRAARGGIALHDFGLLCHPTLQFGASPDGINELGIMVEIKCPWKRRIEANVVPEQYEIQVQGQLAVCGLRECDYVECEMEEYASEAEFLAGVGALGLPAEQFGVIAAFADGVYAYSPPLSDAAAAAAWRWEERGSPLRRVHRWRLRKMQIVRIKYDAERFDTAIAPEINSFWAQVQSDAEAVRTFTAPQLLAGLQRVGTAAEELAALATRGKVEVLNAVLAHPRFDDIAGFLATATFTRNPGPS